jgi:MiaB-like tRNA modifying enzyme
MEAEAALEACGHIPSSFDDAFVIILNTCAVTEHTQRWMMRRIRELQGRRLIVAGCLAKAVPSAFKDFPGIRIHGILQESSMPALLDAIDMVSSIPPSEALLSPLGNAARRAPCRASLCAVVNISEGCCGGCTYCIVRLARGRLQSRSPQEIMERIRRHVEDGAVEVQLASQDAAAYGQDIGSSLSELLMAIRRMPGRFMVRVGMMNPGLLDESLVQVARAMRSKRVYSFQHLPLQSGSDRVLKAMGRVYTSADFIKTVDLMREHLPGISLTTDVIAGFPGETDEEFIETVEVVRRVHPDKVNITRYSRRPGTVAAEFYDMPDRVKKDRSRTMTKLWHALASDANGRFCGKDVLVLVTETGNGDTMKGRTHNYTGVVVTGGASLGDMMKVKITSANPFYISGRIIERIGFDDKIRF